MINEKETLHGLNDRFAGFIEKVRHLERQNQLLESEIREMKERRRRSPSSLDEEHGAELAELRRLLRDVTQEKHRVEAEHRSLEEELARLSGGYEREVRGRADAEGGVAALKRDIGDARQAKVQLDRKAQSLVDDVDYLKKSHEAEVSRMAARVQEAAARQQALHRDHVDFGKADLTAALRDIRAQLEGHATSDLRQADEGFRAQFARLTEAAESKREALRAGQQEVQEVRRSLQAQSMELDCNRGTRDALERQLGEVEDRHNDDILQYQDTIKELENELISAKFDTSAHLREYQDLLNVKMELDVEILSYRKLLEGEETRLSAISGAPVSMPYIYRQSPVHTLPCLGRAGGPGGRAEPHYKSVDEIVTETTREIEGESPDTVRAEEEACDDEAERESQEEEAEVEDSGQSDKHRPDRDTEQASDSQQSQVESAERSEQGDDDAVEERSAMDKAEVECQAESTENNDRPTAEFTENNDKPTAESTENNDKPTAESTENNDRPTAERAHSEEVRSIEATGTLENEPRDSAANVNVNGQMGSDVAMTTQTVPKDAAAKAADSKIEESEEVKMTESEVDKKVGALKDNVDTAQANMLKDESSAKCPTDSGNVQVSSIVDKLQGEAPSLPTETMEKITDLTVALSVPRPKDTTLQPEKQNKETPSVVPRGEETEDRITESMAVCNKADTVKSPIGHEVAKIIEKAEDDADKEKDKSASVKSDPPKLEGEKSDSGDKTHTVEPVFPKDKIALSTEENKDTKQGLPDSSKTQEPSNAVDDASDLEKDKRTAAKSDMAEPPKREGDVSISEDKPQTVDATSAKEKIALTAETKDPQEAAPDSSKTQKPSNGKLEDEKSDSEDKTHTVEPIFPKEKIAVTEESKDSSQTQEQSSAIAESSDLDKDKHTVAKSDMAEPPKLDSEKSISEDKPQTVEKIAVTEESKDSSQTQEQSIAIDKSSDLEKDKHTVAKSDMAEPPKLDGEKSISGDNTQTVGATSPKEEIALTADKTQTVKLPKEKIAVTEKRKVSQPDSSKTEEQSSAIAESSDSEENKHTVAKSDMTEPPKLEGKVSISEDKPQTVEPIFPKEKIAVSTVENKDTKQGLPDSSKTQESSNAIDESSDLDKNKRTAAKSDMTEPPKLDGEKSISEAKPQTVEPIFPKEKIVVTEESKDSSQSQEQSNATYSEKDKHTVAKSDMAEPPKLDGEKSISEDKPQTVEPIFPKEKIAVSTVENKDTKQGVPDSSKTQEPSNAIDDASDLKKDKRTAAKSDMTEPPKGDGEKPNTGDNTQTVDATSPKEKIAPTADKTQTVKLPKEKIAVTEKSKVSQPDSSKTQEQSSAIAESSDSEENKHTVAKSDMTEPPKLDGEKSISENKPQTVLEPIFPKEKIAVTEESKDSSQTQEQSSAIAEYSDLDKDKHTFAKSDMAEPPKLDSEKSISEDKPQTVEPIFPKEKIAVTEESKDSSQTQEQSIAIDKSSDLEKDKHTVAKSDMAEPPKLDGEKSISGDNTQTVDATSPKEEIALTADKTQTVKLSKEKIAVTEKSKVSQPDSSKTQEQSSAIAESSDSEENKHTVAKSDMTEPPKLDGEKSISEDKPQTVLEPIFPKEKISVTEESKDSSQTQEQSSAIAESSDLDKDKHTVAKSDMAEPPKLEGKVSISEDKPQTVEPIFPKEKIAVSTVENKDTKQGVPDSSKTQESSNAVDDASDLKKDKCTAAKSDMTEPPKGDGEKPNTGDNTQTVDATSPKEKIALTAETKDSQEGAPDSSKTQKPSNGKLEDEKSDSEDKTHTVEPIFLKEKIAVTEESKNSSQTQEQSSAIAESSDLDKDEHTVAKSDMTEPPKLEGKVSISEDKPQTVEPIFPKEKIAVSTVENKDTKQGVPDSSKTQESSNAVDDASDLEKDKHTVAKSDTAEPPKLEGEVPSSEDKPQTVEPIFPKEKIAVTEENKDAKQPDGSKPQEPSKVPEKINNAKEKEEKLKDSAKNKDSGKITENITEPIEISETKTEPIDISETKTTSQKEPAGTSTVSVTAKTVGGLMSEAAKPKTETGFANGIGGIEAENNEPIKAVPQLGEAAKEKTNTSI